MNNKNSSNGNEGFDSKSQSESTKDLQSLAPSRQPNEALKNEANYPSNYEGIYTEGYYGAAQQGDEKQLLSGFFSILKKYWFLILSFNLLITAASIIYVAQKPDFYQAAVIIQVNAENNPAAGVSREGGSAVIVNNPGNDPVYFTTQLQVLEGTGLLRRVAKTLDLEHNRNFLDPQYARRLTVWQSVGRMFGFYRPPAIEQTASKTNETVENKLNLNSEKPLDPDIETEKYAPIVARLKKNLSVLPVKDMRTANRETRLIEVQYTHEDPQVAAKIVNAIGDAYVLQNLEQKIQMNASAGDFLQKRVAELQSGIRLGEERLINYSKNNQIVSLDAGQNTVVQRFTDLSMKLGQAENDRINAQTAHQAALQNQMRSATAESKDPQVVGLEARLGDLRQKLAQLKTEYTDDWFEVVQTKKQIESVENQLLSIRKRASDIQIATLEERLNESVARERELRSSFEQQRGEVIRQNEASINYRIIQQEIATNKTLLDGLLQRSRENDVILNGMPNNVLVADRAAVPDGAAGPERMRNVLLAFLVSLLVGGGLAFMLDWLNDSVHNSDTIESDLGLPLLAAIPFAPLGLKKRLLPENLLARLKNKQRQNQYNLAGFEKPEFSEAYLQLRTHLMLSTAGGPPQLILVTSGAEGEGKSLTALNLATSLAETGSNVLLIDADLRFPRIHILKELNNDLGLTTLLTIKDVHEALVYEMIQKDVNSNLHVLTAGERTVNPANLLCSEEMQSLLKILSAKYTHIIIDSPPVLYFADSQILATLVDAVIVVVRDNVSSKQMVLKAKKMLNIVGAKIVGMVLNATPRKWTKYHNYNYYNSDEEFPPESGYQTLKLN